MCISAPRSSSPTRLEVSDHWTERQGVVRRWTLYGTNLDILDPKRVLPYPPPSVTDGGPSGRDPGCFLTHFGSRRLGSRRLGGGSLGSQLVHVVPCRCNHATSVTSHASLFVACFLLLAMADFVNGGNLVTGDGGGTLLWGRQVPTWGAPTLLKVWRLATRF